MNSSLADLVSNATCLSALLLPLCLFHPRWGGLQHRRAIRQAGVRLKHIARSGIWVHSRVNFNRVLPVPSDLHSPDSQPIFPPPNLPPKQPGLFARLRNWFLAGLVIAGPLAVTIWLVWWFINTVDQWVKPLVPPSLWPDVYLPVRVPGTGVLLAIMGLVLLGFLATNIAGRTLLNLSEVMLDGMPIVRGLY
ncbi:MAG: DUF502 domain-containing protein, partial [Alphaproteobacteria bacterium]|nr:DUF502 domain-containing protein [Alphaproteobacteria bacterium]